MTDAWGRPWPPRDSKSIPVPSLEAQGDIKAITLGAHYTDSMIKPDYSVVVRHMTGERKKFDWEPEDSTNKNLDSEGKKE